MKRREIMCLLAAAGCILLLAPLRTRAANLQDLLSIGTIDTEKTADVEEEPIEEDEDREGADLFAMTQSSAEGQLDKGAEENGDKAEEADTSDDAGDKTEEADTSDDAGEQDESSVQEESGERNSALQEILGDAIGSSVILESTRTETEYAQAYEKAKNANWGYTNLGIANVDNNLNIRAAAAEDGKLVGKLPKNAACEVLDSDDTWAYIKSGKVEGYVSLEFLLTGIPAKRRAEELATTMARVTTDSLKVRAEANTESEVITLVPNGEELEVADVEGDWVRVYLDDEEVFVSAEYVEVSSELGTAITMTELLYGQGVSDVSVCQGISRQSLCVGRYKPDQRSGLFRVCT